MISNAIYIFNFKKLAEMDRFDKSVPTWTVPSWTVPNWLLAVMELCRDGFVPTWPAFERENGGIYIAEWTPLDSGLSFSYSRALFLLRCLFARYTPFIFNVCITDKPSIGAGLLSVYKVGWLAKISFADTTPVNSILTQLHIQSNMVYCCVPVAQPTFHWMNATPL